jgi:hypothetical protein
VSNHFYEALKRRPRQPGALSTLPAALLNSGRIGDLAKTILELTGLPSWLTEAEYAAVREAVQAVRIRLIEANDARDAVHEALVQFGHREGY